jgi:hypothetical protein
MLEVRRRRTTPAQEEQRRSGGIAPHPVAASRRAAQHSFEFAAPVADTERRADKITYDFSRMAMDFNAMRYEIELDVLERRPDLSDPDAIALLRSEFQLAVNASYFIALSEDDPIVTVVSRTVPQEGVARYALTLEFTERRELSEGDAIALVHSEFVRALNASHFWRICVDDPTVTVVSRTEATPSQLRWAA